jgi:hypothetical protein
MSEGDGATAESAFCSACGVSIDASARFCRSCGVDQQQEPVPEIRSEQGAVELAGLYDALTERHGFSSSQPPPGDSAFGPGESGVVGVLRGLPTRVDCSQRSDGETPLIRVRFGVAAGDLGAAREALSEASAARVVASRSGVEVLAAAAHAGHDSEAALAYVEDLARRAAAAMKPEACTAPTDGGRALTVSGYPQWVQTPDASDVEGVELRHFELRAGYAEWPELAVQLAASADGAMVATGAWDDEAPFISLMGRVMLMRQGDGGRETPVMFGSGVCTLTNGRLLAVVYARPDDDVLRALGENLRDSGISFQDGSGRSVNPYSAMSEEEKTLQFIDEAGAVDEQGGGVVLALSAVAQAFARMDLEGGVLQRGLGIPGLKLSGAPLSLDVVPFRVLDSDSHTVKPRRGQIKDAVNAWWAMTTQASHRRGAIDEPEHRAARSG